MYVVTVNYNTSHQSYAYLTDIEGIEKGDTLVVDSPSNGFTCVTVVSVEETVESVTKATKWVVSKVDVAAYKERMQKAERRKVLVAKLKKMQEQALEKDMFSKLGELDPNAIPLIEELKKLA